MPNRYDDCLRSGAAVRDATTCPRCGLPTETPDPLHDGPRHPVTPAPYTQPYGPPPAYAPPYPGPPGYGTPYPAAYGAGPVYAGTGVRIGGYLLDWLFVTLVGLVLGVALGVMVGVATATGSGSSAAAGRSAENLGNLLGVVVFFAYFCTCTAALGGRTLGMRIVGIKVVRAADGSVPSWGQAFGRYGLLFVMLLPCGIPALICAATLGNDPQHRGWHDRAAGTLVVRT